MSELPSKGHLLNKTKREDEPSANIISVISQIADDHLYCGQGMN
uniref:Uncharacterized protein n=1 Tax=Anguilla anguilla TaxID=7936 RepID=A0A0E9QCW2_ANGAN